MNNKTLFVGIATSTVFLFVFFFLFLQNHLSFSYIPREDQPFIKKLAPHERVIETSIVSIVDEPVYVIFDLPRDFASLKIDLGVLASSGVKLGIGYVVDDAGNFEIINVPLDDVDSVQHHEVIIDGSKVYQNEGVFRLILSSPDIDASDILVFEEIHFSVDLSPFTFSSFVKNMLKTLYYGQGNAF